MNPKRAAALFISLIILLSATLIQSGEFPKILLSVTETPQTRGAAALLANSFLEANFQAIMPEDLGPTASLQPGDLGEAIKGNVFLLRKVAAFSYASLLFTGHMEGSISSEKVLGIKMNKAVATIAFRVIETASGKNIDTGRLACRGVDTSPEEAMNAAMGKMADELSKRLREKAGAKFDANSGENLAQFRKTFEKKQTPLERPVVASAPKPSTQVAAPRGECKTAPKTAPKTASKTAPKIIVTMPLLDARSLVLTVKHRELIEGQVKIDSELVFFRINGQDAHVDDKGFFSESVPIRKKTQNIVIEAMDKSGNKARKEFLVTRESSAAKADDKAVAPQQMPTLWGLAIGVSEYGSSAFDLKFADKDASSLADFMKKQEGSLFSEVSFKTLLNKDATRDSVLAAISTHLGKAAPDDVVFIFIAGHGIRHPETGSYYFMPYDADFHSVLSKGLRMSDLNESIEILSKNVGKVVVAMDTCHAGAMGQTGARALSGGDDLAQALKAASGRFILAASKGGEVSLENDQFKLNGADSGHGVFTYTLLQGMSGHADYDGNHCVTLNEISHYVAKEVPRLTNGRQHPYFRSEGTDMPLILLQKQ